MTRRFNGDTPAVEKVTIGEQEEYEPPRLVLLGNAHELLAQAFGTSPDSIGDACNQGSCT